MFAFAGAAFGLFTRPKEAVIELGGDEHSLPTAVLFAIVCAALSGGLSLALGGTRATAIVFGLAIAAAPWIYGVVFYLLLKLLGSVTVTLAGGIRFGAALTVLAPLVKLLTFAAWHIGAGTTLFVSSVLPLLAVIAYSALAASAAFETARDPTWIVFTALAVVTFCWGTCDTVAGRDRYDEDGKVLMATDELPRPPPARAAPQPAKRAEPTVDAGAPATWGVRVVSIPPGAVVFVEGKIYGRCPVDVQVPNDKESVNLRLVLGLSEKLTTASRDQFQVLVTMPPPPTLRFDGAYHAVRGKQHQWLRFSMSGFVASAESLHDVPAKKVLKLLNASGKSAHYKFEAENLTFALTPGKNEPQAYWGTVVTDGLKLRTKGDEKPVEYKFVKP